MNFILNSLHDQQQFLDRMCMKVQRFGRQGFWDGLIAIECSLDFISKLESFKTRLLQDFAMCIVYQPGHLSRLKRRLQKHEDAETHL